MMQAVDAFDYTWPSDGTQRFVTWGTGPVAPNSTSEVVNERRRHCVARSQCHVGRGATRNWSSRTQTFPLLLQPPPPLRVALCSPSSCSTHRTGPPPTPSSPLPPLSTTAARQLVSTCLNRRDRRKQRKATAFCKILALPRPQCVQVATAPLLLPHRSPHQSSLWTQRLSLWSLRALTSEPSESATVRCSCAHPLYVYPLCL
jgi:hypothetical protein